MTAPAHSDKSETLACRLGAAIRDGLIAEFIFSLGNDELGLFADNAPLRQGLLGPGSHWEVKQALRVYIRTARTRRWTRRERAIGRALAVHAGFGPPRAVRGLA